MLYLTCTMISSVDRAHYRVSRAKEWVSVYGGTRDNTAYFGNKGEKRKGLVLKRQFTFDIAKLHSTTTYRYKLAHTKDSVLCKSFIFCVSEYVGKELTLF